MLHFLMNVLFDRISLFFVVVVVVLLLSRKPKINRNRKASYLQTCPNVSFLSAKIVGERILSLREWEEKHLLLLMPSKWQELMRPLLFPMQMKERKFLF